MSTHEVAISLKWLMALLRANNDLTAAAPGGVHRGRAPAGTATPFVVLGLQSGSATLSGNAVRLMSKQLFLAKAVGETAKSEDVAQAAAILDDALVNGVKTAGMEATGGLILACYPEQPFMLDEVTGSEEWTHIGGLYRLLTQKT